MFTNAANFSNMTEDAEVCVSKVVHKAYIDVDEKGTEAAAVTSNSIYHFILVYINVNCFTQQLKYYLYKFTFLTKNYVWFA